MTMVPKVQVGKPGSNYIFCKYIWTLTLLLPCCTTAQQHESSIFFGETRGPLHVKGPSPDTQPDKSKVNSNTTQIIHLTTHRFTMYELSLLRKGLGFAPTTDYNAFMWIKDLNLFIRKVKWKSFFEKNNQARCLEQGLEESDLTGVEVLH